ncbi:MAG TPA: hypothetical protein VH416_01570 [Gaiellaceae bacterium]|jgi:hypothetical protein
MSRKTLGFLPPADPRWGYDDPSGVPDEVPVTVHVPETLLVSIQAEAARTGITPTAWLLDLVHRSLYPPRGAAA